MTRSLHNLLPLVRQDIAIEATHGVVGHAGSGHHLPPADELVRNQGLQRVEDEHNRARPLIEHTQGSGLKDERFARCSPGGDNDIGPTLEPTQRFGLMRPDSVHEVRTEEPASDGARSVRLRDRFPMLGAGGQVESFHDGEIAG